MAFSIGISLQLVAVEYATDVGQRRRIQRSLKNKLLRFLSWHIAGCSRNYAFRFLGS